MKKLALLLTLLPACLLGQTTGNPQLGGHWPSLTSYASLNQVAPPSDYTFEATHLDAAHGVDHSVGVLTASPNFYYIKYELLETQLNTDPEISAIASYCTGIGADPENAFYHYFDDTVVNTLNSNTGTATCSDGSTTTTIPGWGGGSATSRSQARVKSCPTGGNWRYVWNHADTTCLQPYMKYRTRNDVTNPVTGTAHFRGSFWDEFSATSGCSPSSTCIVALMTAVSGGHIAELSNENRATLASDGKYEINLKSLLTAIQSDVQTYTSGDGNTYPNQANLTDNSSQALAIASGGVLTEFFDTEATNISSSLGTQYLWQYADPIVAADKIFIWTEGDPTTPTDATFNACDYTSADSRHRMWSMTNYWQMKDVGQKYAWYSQRPQYIDLSTFWYAAQQHDIGQPSGARSMIQSGTTAGGYTFAIFERDFTKGKVFTVTRNGYAADSSLSYSERVGTSISLGGTYHVLNYDNTLGPAITTLQPCYLEAVTLVADTSSTPISGRKGGHRKGGHRN